MRLVYTNESSVLVSNAKNILTNEGIASSVKNEHSATGGHVNFAHMELWVNHEGDYERATTLLSLIHSTTHSDDWQCSTCNEKNDPSFDFCWKCNGEAKQ